MNLPNCPSPVNGDRISVDDDGELRSASSGLGESKSGGRESPRALQAADRSSKVPHVSGGRSAISRRPRWSWLVGKCCWGWEEPFPSGGVPKIRRNQRRQKRVLAATFRARLPAFWPVSGNDNSGDATVIFQASNRYQARPVRWPELEVLGGSSRGFGSRIRVKNPLSLSLSLSGFLTCF